MQRDPAHINEARLKHIPILFTNPESLKKLLHL